MNTIGRQEKPSLGFASIHEARTDDVPPSADFVDGGAVGVATSIRTGGATAGARSLAPEPGGDVTPSTPAHAGATGCYRGFGAPLCLARRRPRRRRATVA